MNGRIYYTPVPVKGQCPDCPPMILDDKGRCPMCGIYWYEMENPIEYSGN